MTADNAILLHTQQSSANSGWLQLQRKCAKQVTISANKYNGWCSDCCNIRVYSGLLLCVSK